jgi:hypothetical protein
MGKCFSTINNLLPPMKFQPINNARVWIIPPIERGKIT